MKTQEEKDGLLALLKKHQSQDDFIRGAWLTNVPNDSGEFKGCFYGCTMQTEDSPREAFSEKYGVDLWYCYLTEKLFENLPKGEFESFPYKSIEILPLNFDFNIVKSKFNKAMLLKQLDWVKDENVRAILVETSKLFDVPFNEITESAARSAAESAAWSAESAAWSAESAARSAARSAESAARSAESAARSAAWSAAWYAARSAARSAAWSAESAARSSHYVWMRDTLFVLILENS